MAHSLLLNVLSHLDALTEWLRPQLVQERNNFILQQDGALLHYCVQVLQFLNESLPHRLAELATET
jgi:hypothetical protein